MSVEPFLEVMFQAELSRYEDPDFEEVARRTCNEDPDTRQKKIQELRSMIIERGQCHPRRMDDEFLLKYLRCRRFIIPLAHKLMVRHDEFRRQYPYIYDCKVFQLDEAIKMQGFFSGTLPDSPISGRTLIIRIRCWDPDTVTLEDFFRTIAALSEIVCQQPRIQILGTSVIVDMAGFGLKHLKRYSSSAVYQVIGLVGMNTPILLNGFHFINYGWIASRLLFFIKPFISSSRNKYVHLHGSDITSLHKYVDPSSLPEEYGGHCKREVYFEEWISRIRKYARRDEFLIRDLRNIGYTVELDDDKSDNKIWFDDLLASDIPSYQCKKEN